MDYLQFNALLGIKFFCGGNYEISYADSKSGGIICRKNLTLTPKPQKPKNPIVMSDERD